jgi:hypothetical protein
MRAHSGRAAGEHTGGPPSSLPNLRFLPYS